jgi:hypothetical protein
MRSPINWKIYCSGDRNPRFSIVDQDLQHREPAEQLGAGCPGSRLAFVAGLEVAIDD